MPAARVIVIGGGITGLAAAHRLVELSRERSAEVEVQVFEGGARPGGVISTVEKDGCLLEEGPDSFIIDKPWALALCKRLGLDDQLIPTSAIRKSHVLWDGRLHPVPEGFHLMAPTRLGPVFSSSLFSMDTKARIAMERLVPPRQSTDDESVGAFVRRRLGGEALERLVQPLVSGIYGGDPDKLSMQAAFSRFAEMERKYGSLMAAAKAEDSPLPQAGVSGARYSLFMSLKSGMGSLVQALMGALPPRSVLVDASVQSILRTGGRWEVTLDTGYKAQADGVILALPAHKTARLLRPIDGGAADALASVRSAASANVHFAFRWSALTKAPESFGFVVPGTLKKPLLGCTFASAKFPGRAPKDVAILRAFVHPDFLEMDGEEITQKILGELRLILGIQGEPLFTSFKFHPQSMPQYEVGHVNRVAAVDWRIKSLPRLAVAGNALRGVGLPDCIRSAEDAAELMMIKLGQANPG